VNKQKLLAKLQNSGINVRYNDFVTLINAYGFNRTRGEGSHEIYRCTGIPEIVNIQNDKGNAKPYQVKQFLFLIEKYNLKLKEDENA